MANFQFFSQPQHCIGASTDTKPTHCRNGTTAWEHDTGLTYITYDEGTTWVVKPADVTLKSPSGDSLVDDTADAVKVTLVDGTGGDSTMFGEPTLQMQGNGEAVWSRGSNIIASHQKGSTGWFAKLYGGVQATWGSAAEMYIPVNEMPLTDLTVGTTMWSYFMTATELGGVGMVVWVHDPDDFDKRAEISQVGNTMEKTSGWNAHELAAGDDCVWYGENTGTHDTTVTAGTVYNFSQFLTDDVFSTYKIYRISFAYGFETGNSEYNDALLADVKINGVQIPLKPDSSGTGRIGRRHVTVAAGAIALTLAPYTPFRLLSLDFHSSAVLDTGEVLTLTKDAKEGALYDTLLLSEDLFIGSRTSYFATFGEGYDFDAGDEIDLAQANGSDDDLGATLVYQTVFN